ncbi:hypothetical protein LMG27952_07627 [Paraburkholderia hiiakae]|uniref:Uncharacterized protein n=1 Tax=Paraburkholderia hiiakae TaxID=1081782 RepID=A0ABN7IJ99_9BURK|nr:hypothetical protein LMG27952_07627 [Paraburkholderia hiiakae]
MHFGPHPEPALRIRNAASLWYALWNCQAPQPPAPTHARNCQIGRQAAPARRLRA